jgi:hypothetical protein
MATSFLSFSHLSLLGVEFVLLSREALLKEKVSEQNSLEI